MCINIMKQLFFVIVLLINFGKSVLLEKEEEIIEAIKSNPDICGSYGNDFELSFDLDQCTFPSSIGRYNLADESVDCWEVPQKCQDLIIDVELGSENSSVGVQEEEKTSLLEDLDLAGLIPGKNHANVNRDLRKAGDVILLAGVVEANPKEKAICPGGKDGSFEAFLADNLAICNVPDVTYIMDQICGKETCVTPNRACGVTVVASQIIMACVDVPKQCIDTFMKSCGQPSTATTPMKRGQIKQTTVQPNSPQQNNTTIQPIQPAQSKQPVGPQLPIQHFRDAVPPARSVQAIEPANQPNQVVQPTKIQATSTVYQPIQPVKPMESKAPPMPSILSVQSAQAQQPIERGQPKQRMPDAACADKNQLCCFWASTMECDKNAIWMKVNCQKACGTCGCTASNTASCKVTLGACGNVQPTAVRPQPFQPKSSLSVKPDEQPDGYGVLNNGNSDSGCTDNSPHCKYWADNGECTKNAFWMEPNCQKSCNSCGKTIGDVNKPKPIPGCTNNHETCQFWESLDQCEKNAKWMKQNCKLSCGTC